MLNQVPAAGADNFDTMTDDDVGVTGAAEAYEGKTYESPQANRNNIEADFTTHDVMDDDSSSVEPLTYGNCPTG